ncbi:MAG: DUF4350 domain-containing protein [FCB group bacterium]|nr:DUF4350 domain-containing protein [FCB group bacterium]
MKIALILIALTVFISCNSEEVQKGDTEFIPEINNPNFATGAGPVVLIDEGHNNYHTMDGRYKPFAETLRRDGYSVRPHSGAFSTASLDEGDILVIANALPPDEGEDEAWSSLSPAFTPDEIQILVDWVRGGGSLFLVADHMPFPAVAADLALALGFEFNNGYAIDTIASGPTVFTRKDNTLHAHLITDGQSEENRISAVASFTGQAFRATIAVDTILSMPSSTGNYTPEEEEEFDRAKMTFEPVGGWLQGAVCEVGQGRLAVFGEAAMFTAQTHGTHKFGMSHPDGRQNLQFLRNLMLWLADKN